MILQSDLERKSFDLQRSANDLKEWARIVRTEGDHGIGYRLKEAGLLVEQAMTILDGFIGKCLYCWNEDENCPHCQEERAQRAGDDQYEAQSLRVVS